MHSIQEASVAAAGAGSRRTHYLLSCLLAAILAASGCSTDSDDGIAPIVISAADGSATLRIPDGALPDGVSADDISIEREDALVESFAGTARVWSFLPHGLEFNSPVRLQIDVDVDPGAFFSVDHFSDGLIETPEIEVDYDASSGRITGLTTQLDHFSYVGVFVLNGSSLLEVMVGNWTPSANDADVGNDTSPTLELEPPGDFSYSATWLDEETNIRWRKDVAYTGAAWNSAVAWGASAPPLTPDSQSSSQTSPGTHSYPAQFRCQQTGDFTVVAWAFGSIDVTTTMTNLDSGAADPIDTARLFSGFLASTDATCYISRETKEAFAAFEALLGVLRIVNLSSPGAASVDLSDHAGKFGYYLRLKPGETIEVAVNTSQKAAEPAGGVVITYFPQYSPGYDFVDGIAGTTAITNLDNEQGNGVLLGLEGSGSVSVDVSVAN